jgi:hypothetical protein
MSIWRDSPSRPHRDHMPSQLLVSSLLIAKSNTHPWFRTGWLARVSLLSSFWAWTMQHPGPMASLARHGSRSISRWKSVSAGATVRALVQGVARGVGIAIYRHSDSYFCYRTVIIIFCRCVGELGCFRRLEGGYAIRTRNAPTLLIEVA